MGYVARFATSTGKLEAYLRRKLRERGWEGEREPDIATLIARFVDLGYVDDGAYARSKGSSLLRRGYGPRRVSQALGEAGIDPALREETRASEASERAAALALARKRRFGPFGPGPLERERREKQIGAMLRAGHSLDSAREMIDATSEAAALRWVAEAAESLEDDDDHGQS